MFIRTAVVVTAALTLAACGSKTESTVVNDTAGMTVNDTMDVAPLPSPAQSFANAAAASDAFEIESSKAALATSKSAAIKRFAQSMIDAHTSSTAKLISAATQAQISTDPTLNADQAARLAELKGKSGADFDAAYVSAQKAAHQSALDALKSYAASGDSVPLKAFATEMVPTVTAHLNIANGLKP